MTAIATHLYNSALTKNITTHAVHEESKMGANTKEFNDANFKAEVLCAAKPVLVDFWAPWCGPCRAIAPMIEELATENLGSIVIGKLNIDESPKAAQDYGVSSIPTLMMFKGGQVTQRFVGGQPKAKLQAVLDAAKNTTDPVK